MSNAEKIHKLLIVDDEQAIREMLYDYLRSQGFECSKAGDGLEALEIMQDFHADIVLTDIQMPRMDGMKLIEELKSSWPDTDIISITAYAKNYTYTDVINAGASDFIAKPFNFDELDAKLNRIIRERTLRSELQRLSIKDGLTDLYNRRYFDKQIVEEMERATRQGYPLFLMIIDLDGFKRVNDEFGHQAGDELLRKLADVLRNSTRKHVDIVCRYGGDEFAIIVPQATDEQIESIASRMQKKFLEIDRKGTTLSIGVSCASTECGNTHKDLNALIRQADDAMYEAKRGGGNRVVINKSRLESAKAEAQE